MSSEAPWAIVLAAGEGTRLRTITTDARGQSIPKQFCSLEGGQTLLGDALERANSMTSPERVVTIVAEEHRDLWESEVSGIPTQNVIVQPRNRGTAAGILLPLASVMARDPRARIAVFPSDHYVEKEAILRTSVLDALESVVRDPRDVVLLGITPDQAVSGYGWILPAPTPGRPSRVERFVEKPPIKVAEDLLASGGLWNSFVFAARGETLLGLYARRLPGLVAAFEQSCHPGGSEGPMTMEELYADLNVQDFSHDVLEGSESSLRVLRVPRCGWTDLGTPERVEECLRTKSGARPAPLTAPCGRPVLARALDAGAPPTPPGTHVGIKSAIHQIPAAPVSQETAAAL